MADVGAHVGARSEEAAQSGESPPASPQRKRKPRGFGLLAAFAVASSFLAVPTFGIGAAIAVILLAASWLLYRRGYAVRRLCLAAIAALGISAVSAGACWQLLLSPVEVEGREEARQNDAQRAFERAFEEASAPPPRRDEAPKE